LKKKKREKMARKVATQSLLLALCAVFSTVRASTLDPTPPQQQASSPAPASAPTSPEEQMSEVQRLSRAHFDFTLDLYSVLIGRDPRKAALAHDEVGAGAGDQQHQNVDVSKEHNLLLSPYSVASVLSMLYLGAGARSNTSLQLRHGMSYHNLSYSEVRSSLVMFLWFVLLSINKKASKGYSL
jgi:hypothetical protein